MQIDLPVDQLQAVESLAAERGSTPAEEIQRIVADALEQRRDYDRWFRQQVREGIAAAQRGEFVPHEEVGRMIDERYPG